MNWTLISLRGLQLVCLFSATIAVFGGGTFVLFGTEGLAMVVGTEYPALSPLIDQSAKSIEPSMKITFDTWYRALGWYWLVSGVMLFWITP